MLTDPYPETSAARLDRLPWSPKTRNIVARLSVGAFFEIYEIALTGLAGPLLVRAGVFKAVDGLFGLPDLATFAFATFAGLCIGVLTSSQVADRFGRRKVLTLAPMLYGVATLVLALQGTVAAICLWRFVAMIGVGAEVVAVDAYLAEIMSKECRGRGFAFSKSIQYAAVPIATAVAASCSALTGHDLTGWRLLLIVPGLGAPLVIWIRRDLPESPRWLALHGRSADAALAVARLERVRTANNETAEPTSGAYLTTHAGAPKLFSFPLRRRVTMMIVASCASSLAYYGFSNWLPTVIEARGVATTRSLAYTTLIACAYPLSPLCFTLFSDRVERKWQIMSGAAVVAISGVAFAEQSTPAGWIACGLLVSVGNNLVAYASHTYRSELFPTVVRARAIGAIYSCDRLLTAFSSYLFAWLLQRIGTGGVLLTVAGAAFIELTVIAVFGPRTQGVASEDICR